MTDRHYDVIVAGGGGAGLAAAIEARSAGARVALLEKNDSLGGSTAWSVGSITASGTPHQRRAGIVDDADGHFADMPAFAGDLAGRDNDELRRILCDEVPAAFEWLLGLGVRFHGPMPEPPHAKPRMHTVLPNSRAFIHHLERHARRSGVDVFTGQRVVALVEDSGRVTGVRTAAGDVVRAARGTILAAGDFTSDPELKARFMGPREALVDGVNPTATGDGQKLALALGARIVNGDLALGPELRLIPPARATLARRLPPSTWLASALALAMRALPASLLRPLVMGFVTTALAPSRALFEQGAVLVDRDGRRVGDALDTLALELADRPGKLGYIVFDGTLAARFSAWPCFVSTAPGVAYAYVPDYRRNRPDVFTEASSLPELARSLRMDAATLGAAMAWADGPGGSPRATPPFVALGPVRPVFVHNEGGLAVDRQHRVLGPGDRPIPGLYAVGSTGQGGLLLKGHGHHLAWAFVSGRRAGRLAASQPPVDQTLSSGAGSRSTVVV